MLTLAAAELLARLMGIRPWTNTDPGIHVTPGGRLFTSHPTRGYTQLPGSFVVTLRNGYSFTLTHLPSGLRITHPLPTYTHMRSKPEIWIFGCSLTHGWSLQDQETYPWLLQTRLLDYEVVNYGVEGYGTLQALIQLREALATQPHPHAVGLLALATWRSGPYVRRVGLTIAATAALVWAVPYFAPGLTHGPGDALLLLALASLAARPGVARCLGALLPYAAGFGAAVVFFEMLTGQLPIAAAWLAALTLAAGRDEECPEGVPAPAMALAAMTAFGLGAAATVLVKQLLAGLLTEPKTGAQFVESLRYYMDVPASQGGWPGIVQPFVQLVWWSGVLMFGQTWAGYGLVAATVLTWPAAVIRGWQQRHQAHGRDVLLLVSLALVPVAWVLLLPRHTDIHAGMMVRLLVVPISLAPLALCWPPARRRRSVTASM